MAQGYGALLRARFLLMDVRGWGWAGSSLQSQNALRGTGPTRRGGLSDATGNNPTLRHTIRMVVPLVPCVVPLVPCVVPQAQPTPPSGVQYIRYVWHIPPGAVFCQERNRGTEEWNGGPERRSKPNVASLRLTGRRGAPGFGLPARLRGPRDGRGRWPSPASPGLNPGGTLRSRVRWGPAGSALGSEVRDYPTQAGRRWSFRGGSCTACGRPAGPLVVEGTGCCGGGARWLGPATMTHAGLPFPGASPWLPRSVTRARLPPAKAQTTNGKMYGNRGHPGF